MKQKTLILSDGTVIPQYLRVIPKLFTRLLKLGATYAYL